MPNPIRIGAVSALLVSSLMPARADPVFPPSSGVGLDPPIGMAVADGFLGFRNGPASIVIIEFAREAYPQIAGTRERLAAQLQDSSTADFSAGGDTGFIVRGRQTANGRTFRKWVVVLGADTETAMVTAQVPVDDRDIADAAIESALRSIVIHHQPGLAEKIAALPFTVGDFSGFRPALSEAGSVLILTEGPKDVDPEITQPSVVIATSLNQPAPRTERAAFAKTVLSSLKAVRTTDLLSENLFDAAGTQWAAIEARGFRGKTDTPVDISFFVRFGEPDYILVVATAPSADGFRYADRFRRIALSVKPKD